MANPIKVVRAIEKKARKEFGMSKGTTAGKAKVNKKVQKLDTIAEGRTGGNLGYVYKKGKMIEVFGNHSPIKVKPRNIGKLTKQMAPSNKKEIKSINKIIKKQGKAIKPNVMGNPRSAPKVPTKKRGN
jgi:hypothetical protein